MDTVCPALPANHNFTWVTAWGTNDSQLINTCTTPWTPTHCEPGIIGGGTPHWYIGPYTGVAEWRDTGHLNCPDSSLTTRTAGTGPRWTISEWTCSASNQAVARYVATQAGHALGGLQGYNGFNFEQDMWDFWTNHWRG